jgi:hypothetical protein
VGKTTNTAVQIALSGSKKRNWELVAELQLAAVTYSQMTLRK